MCNGFFQHCDRKFRTQGCAEFIHHSNTRHDVFQKDHSGDDWTLDLEIGPGARQTKLRNNTSSNEFMGYVAGKLLWKFSPSASLSENLTSEIGDDTTISRSVTALTAQLAGSLAMKLSFTARHISKVPALVKRKDTETAMTLVYGF
ncbi:MAG: DUF481 domain-containing protein [Candidatus Nitrotoga sp.]